MRRAEDIKKGLACHADRHAQWLHCSECEWHGPGKPPCAEAVPKAAIELIEQLKRERDAAIADLKDSAACFACKSFIRNGGVCRGGASCDMRGFEWRGVQKEENSDENA